MFERTVTVDYTLRFAGKTYQIARADIRPGLRGSRVRIEQRDSGELAVRFGRHYVHISVCAAAQTAAPAAPPQRVAKLSVERRKSDWIQRFYQNIPRSPKARTAGPIVTCAHSRMTTES